MLKKVVGQKTLSFLSGLAKVFSRVSTGRDVPLSLCPGTKKFSCPGVPLSRDKGRSKNPGTNYSVPGHPGTKISEKINRFPVLELHFLVLEHPFLFWNVFFLF
jgi:hypothetical protein